MTIEKRGDLEHYYADAGSWARERLEGVRASRRTAWITAIIAVVVALAEAFAIMFLTPLKTVVPYTLLVDRQTGYVQALSPLSADKISPDTALTQSFLVQYVLGREGYDTSSVQRDYRKVALWSAEPARGDYVAAMQISNPDSPLVRLPRSSSIDARIRSVSPLGANRALVRFETMRRDHGGASQPSQNWVALIVYRFSSAPMSVEDRFINPLGFQVVRYSKNAESPPLVDPAQSPAPPGTTLPNQIPSASERVPATPALPGNAAPAAAIR